MLNVFDFCIALLHSTKYKAPAHTSALTSTDHSGNITSDPWAGWLLNSHVKIDQQVMHS